jgi:hypothetical protein
MANASALNAPYVLPWAGLMAVLAGESELAKVALDRLREIGTRGRAVDANRIGIEAGIAAREGDRAAAVAGFRQSIAALHELGLPWDEAWMIMAAISCLGADTPESVGWAARAADTLDLLEVKPIAALLARMLASPTNRASRTAAGAAPNEAGAANPAQASGS